MGFLVLSFYRFGLIFGFSPLSLFYYTLKLTFAVSVVVFSLIQSRIKVEVVFNGDTFFNDLDRLLQMFNVWILL